MISMHLQVTSAPASKGFILLLNSEASCFDLGGMKRSSGPNSEFAFSMTDMLQQCSSVSTVQRVSATSFSLWMFLGPEPSRRDR